MTGPCHRLLFVSDTVSRSYFPVPGVGQHRFDSGHRNIVNHVSRFAL